MAFSSSANPATVLGDLRFVSGTFTNASGDRGGNITTGLMYILAGDAKSSGVLYPNDLKQPNVRLNHDGSSTVNGTLRVICADADDGTYWAIGH